MLSSFIRTSLVGQMVKLLSTMQEMWVWSLGQEDSLEKEMAIHSSTIAWKIPWTEEPGRLQSMPSQRVRHDWATSISFFLSIGDISLPTICLEITRPHTSFKHCWVTIFPSKSISIWPWKPAITILSLNLPSVFQWSGSIFSKSSPIQGQLLILWETSSGFSENVFCFSVWSLAKGLNIPLRQTIGSQSNWVG